MLFRVAAILLFVAFAAVPAGARDPSDAARRSIEFGVPRAVAVSWTELVVDVPVVVKPVGVNGTIHKVLFSDLRLNGIPFEIDPYEASFDLPDEDPVTLDRPLRLRARFARVAPGVLEEALLPRDELRLTGTVAIDGTFRKWIFSTRREVRFGIDQTRPNPLADYHPLRFVLGELDRWKL